MKLKEKMFFKFVLSLPTAVRATIFIVFLTFCTVSINAQTISSSKGDVTGLPLPRFVSVKPNKVNVRRGPNPSYQIDWVYQQSGVPLKITAEFENWRRVEDFEGEGGWVHSRLLSGKRFVIFLENRTFLKRNPYKKSPALAIVQQGVIAKLITGTELWSEVSVQGYKGWIPNLKVWGTSSDNFPKKTDR